jgi:hypothetical protein
VKLCTLYGAGFFYIPGADTCIKFGCRATIKVRQQRQSG